MSDSKLPDWGSEWVNQTKAINGGLGPVGCESYRVWVAMVLGVVVLPTALLPQRAVRSGQAVYKYKGRTMRLGTIVTLTLFGGLILMAIGNALKHRGSRAGVVMETIGKAIYLLWAGVVVLLVVALIWLAFQFSR